MTQPRRNTTTTQASNRIHITVSRALAIGMLALAMSGPNVLAKEKDSMLVGNGKCYTWCHKNRTGEEHQKCVRNCDRYWACNGSDSTADTCASTIEILGKNESRAPGVGGAEIRTGAGLCLDVHAPDIGNNGGRVQAWACHGQPQQLWSYDRAASAIRVSSGLCLDVHAPEMTMNGGRVQVWACTGAPQQQWTPLNGSLRNAGGLCLDVHGADQTRNGARVQVWQCNGSQQQRFTFGPGQ